MLSHLRKTNQESEITEPLSTQTRDILVSLSRRLKVEARFHAFDIWNKNALLHLKLPGYNDSAVICGQSGLWVE